MSIASPPLLNGLHPSLCAPPFAPASWPPTPSYSPQQLQKLSAASPNGAGAAAYKYGAVSVITPVVLGLLAYGVPAWTAPRP